MVDGSNLVMTDVSAEVAHEDRQILVRESRTGVLRDADQTERDRRIEMYYPSKHTSIQIPRYIDVDHSQIEQVMETLIEQHGEYGPIQIMETAVAYYQLDDEKVSFGHSKNISFQNISYSVLSSENETKRSYYFKESLR